MCVGENMTDIINGFSKQPEVRIAQFGQCAQCFDYEDTIEELRAALAECKKIFGSLSTSFAGLAALQKGTAQENGCRYCHYCGKPVEVVLIPQ